MLNRMLIAAVFGVFFMTVLTLGSNIFSISAYEIETEYAERLGSDFKKDHEHNKQIISYGNHIDFDKNNTKSLKEQLKEDKSSNQIICRDSFHLLIYRVTDGSPICVDEYTTVPKLIDREYATFGKHSLEIATEKSRYSQSDMIRISMINNGDSRLVSTGGGVHFSIYDESNQIVHPPFPLIIPTNNITPFYPNGNITMIFDQIDYYGNSMKSGTYTVKISLLYPIIIDERISGYPIYSNTTFIILP